MDGLRKLFPEGLAGKTFLDIGCGSGVHALAALSLSARSVTAIDIDENSVATTQDLLAKLAPSGKWKAEVKSVFDLDARYGRFDVVYAWGSLHHTGNMWRAINLAAGCVAPGGALALAIYAKTPLDGLWSAEKRIYSRSPRPIQWAIRQAYLAAYVSAQFAARKNPFRDQARGMDFSHDVHDWLGGYPYETATATELKNRLRNLGFSDEQSFVVSPRLGGLLGSGCSEFVFSRPATAPA